MTLSIEYARGLISKTVCTTADLPCSRKSRVVHAHMTPSCTHDTYVRCQLKKNHLHTSYKNDKQTSEHMNKQTQNSFEARWK